MEVLPPIGMSSDVNIQKTTTIYSMMNFPICTT